MNDLIEKNMGLVLTIVNRFNPKNIHEKESYIQAGRIGLWKALSKFSENGGSKFSPYAWNPIKWEIIKEIRTSKRQHEVDNVNHYSQAFNNPSPFWELIPSCLSKDELQVIQLRLEGYNFKEISNKLKLHRSHIKKLFQTAITKIKEYNE
jgi:RNA polymerase sigma factor (sigma-70 family)